MDKGQGLIYRGAWIFNPVPQRNHCLGSQILSAVTNEGRRYSTDPHSSPIYLSWWISRCFRLLRPGGWNSPHEGPSNINCRDTTCLFIRQINNFLNPSSGNGRLWCFNSFPVTMATTKKEGGVLIFSSMRISANRMLAFFVCKRIFAGEESRELYKRQVTKSGAWDMMARRWEGGRS